MYLVMSVYVLDFRLFMIKYRPIEYYRFKEFVEKLCNIIGSQESLS